MKVNREAMRLYAVTDRAWLKEGQTLTSAVEDAIKGGATFVQLREKRHPMLRLRVLHWSLRLCVQNTQCPL